MSEKKLRVGVAGQGRSGFGIHVRWLKEATDNFEIVAVADLDLKRCAEVKKEFGAKTYKDYKDILKHDDIDLFINALPSNLHPKATIEALDNRFHVVCEKPVATKLKGWVITVSPG